MPVVGPNQPVAGPEAVERQIERARLLALAQLVRRPAEGDGGLESLAGQSFRATLLEALAERPGHGLEPGTAPLPRPLLPPPITPPVLASPVLPLPPLAPPPATAPVAPGDEEPLIHRMADRHGVDREFLVALRKIENGGPGREFGVLSVPAPTFTDQARVAAQSVRRSVERYEATGRSAVDPATGRYTENFIRFFSARYAPVGAGNDPANLNAHHARNLVRRYAQLAGAPTARA